MPHDAFAESSRQESHRFVFSTFVQGALMGHVPRVCPRAAFVALSLRVPGVRGAGLWASLTGSDLVPSIVPSAYYSRCEVETPNGLSDRIHAVMSEVDGWCQKEGADDERPAGRWKLEVLLV
ncbi:hypothetical protein PAL_GLEAN10019437 [Pteropus alecto]|uniref:Uncharacterized protein n=1 Tax=Pteropus alecto TaxID=9402 RepID=L5JTS1_PTEAL|nr:hypothetical protein PAL_GLEAN10019437 [Pteropus alecto]